MGTYLDLFDKTNLKTGDDLANQLESDFAKVTIGNKIICPDIFYGVVGYELTIYYDSLIKGLDAGLNSPTGIFVAIDCPDFWDGSIMKAVAYDRFWQITATNMTSGYIGDHELYIRAYDYNGNLIDEKEVVLTVIAATQLSESKNILYIGDSLGAHGDIASKTFDLFTSLGGTVPTYWGTQLNGNVYDECRSGWLFQTFIGTTSPFYINGVIDFAAYRSSLGLTGNFDCVRIMLGVNDCLCSATISVILANCISLVNYILSDSPACKILLEMPSSDANTISSWLVYTSLTKNNYKKYFQDRIHELREAMYNEFIQSEWDGIVYLGQTFTAMDRYYGYPYESRAIGSRISTTEITHTNCVHPNNAGYNQMGDSEFLQLLNILN